MLLERSALKAYFAALAILIVGAVGFRLLISQLNIHLTKEAVDLRRPLDSIPTKLGRWERVGLDTVFNSTMIEELGTRRYLDRVYALDGIRSRRCRIPSLRTSSRSPCPAATSR